MDRKRGIEMITDTIEAGAEKITTKEKILEVSLALFAQKGYSNVYVNEIALAVGIKAPSLYKHFKNKQDIFDCCIKVFYERMQKMTGMFPVLDVSANNFATQISLENFLEVTEQIFCFHLRDEVASSLRKMLSIERYDNAELNAIYEELFLDEPIRFETEFFGKLMAAGELKHGNPKLMAYRYYTPIFFLLTKYDMHVCDEGQALEELALLCRDFYESYKQNK